MSRAGRLSDCPKSFKTPSDGKVSRDSPTTSPSQDYNTLLSGLDPGRIDPVSSNESTGNLALDMQALQYFHNYVLSTGLSLRRDEFEPNHFWKVEIPENAFRHPFLMFAILSLSALHLAVQSVHDMELCRRHRERSVQYQNAALTELRSAMHIPNIHNVTALIAFGRFFSVSRCVQHQLDWLLPLHSAIDHNETGISNLLEFFYLTRGSQEMLLSLQHLLPSDSDFMLPAEAVEQFKATECRGLVDDNLLINVPAHMVARMLALPQKMARLLHPQDRPETSAERLALATNTLLTAYAVSYKSSEVRYPSKTIGYYITIY